MVAAGNDFVVIGDGLQAKNAELADLARKICDRKYSIGADGMLLIEKTKKADARMRIFNADGSEAEMCGNGARCSALYAHPWARKSPFAVKGEKTKVIKLETKAGIIESEVNNDNVRIKLTDPKDIKLNIPIAVNNRVLKVNFVNTGVPHAVIFVEGLDTIDVNNLGRIIRYHSKFAPKGTNVNFVEIINDDFIKVRTYERGVEAETLACGTGSSASAIIAGCRLSKAGNRIIKVKTKSGEILKVYFEKNNNKFQNVWLEGKAKFVYKGRYYV
ncbi:MAG: diaminopimelate epimerase [Candidatus Omnitrophica bacterium]|nr:diaminopimelate epimerase [Candidatus Omnitrophota bacterium]